MKSHVSDLLELAECVYRDAAAKCTDETLDLRDLVTLRSRVEHEGMSFLTITLPTLGLDFERSLAQGQVTSDLFRCFKKRLKTPAFLQGFFRLVFDVETGRILHEPCIAAIEGIRQIAYTFKKLKVDCSPVRVTNTLAKFEQDEQYLKGFAHTGSDIDDFINIARHLWGLVFGNVSDTNVFEFRPRHGPGATAESISGNSKHRYVRWHDRLEPYFPLCSNVILNENVIAHESFRRVRSVPLDQEEPVRITPVPKTLKGPRIIAIEPVCMQYTQQAISQWLVNHLERHSLTRGHVNFTDQEVNRRLAIIASRRGKFATLDLSSASDLVPYDLAIHMFDAVPEIQGAISACRSTRAQMPNGRVIDLKKFASMGSALCFPVEAMYFYTLCVKALIEKHNLPVTYESLKKVSKVIFVYGDDIIVPANVSETVIDSLQKYCCKVNTSKSFYTGRFRESCGMDAYAGYEVTPTYLRHLPPDNRRNTSAIISLVESSNHFFRRGYWQTSQCIVKYIEKLIGKLPIVSETSPGLGLTNPFQPSVSIERWGIRYQRPEVRAWVPSPVYYRDRLDGWDALLKCLNRQGPPDPAQDSEHLKRSVRHGAVALKRRWVPPF